MALKIIRSVRDFRLGGEQSIGFVPTMGAFHEGHIELMRQAKRENDLCVVSIFVNPTQFGPKEDFANYPRQESRDLEMAESAGVDYVFMPTVAEMYPSRSTSIRVLGVSVRWEGASRPGHFDGVATVVAKLFNIVRPTAAYFGLKDFQQCAVVKQMVEDLNFNVSLKFVETVREKDGLAMSSRNAYLAPELRVRAPQLFQVISALGAALAKFEFSANDVDRAIGEHRKQLIEAGFDVDYLAVVDSNTLESVTSPIADSRIIVAARLGNTRLIDNCAVGGDASSIVFGG